MKKNLLVISAVLGLAVFCVKSENIPVPFPNYISNHQYAKYFCEKACKGHGEWDGTWDTKYTARGPKSVCGCKKPPVCECK